MSSSVWGDRRFTVPTNERSCIISSINNCLISSLSIIQNYTTMGFKKIRAPDELWKLIEVFWKKNKDNRKPEQWGQGNTYTNNWASPTYMVSVEDTSLRGGGSNLKQAIWDEAEDTISTWTEQLLTQCSLYGIRVYTTGAVLSPHVDRLPLVSSAIINVAQDLDEPWPVSDSELVIPNNNYPSKDPPVDR